MSDPINPSLEEDKVYTDQAPPKGQPISKKELAAQERQRRIDRERHELQVVLSTPEGEAFLLRIVGWCQVYDPGVLDAQALGRRQLGLRLLGMIDKLSPDSYPNMLLNHLKRQMQIRAEEEAFAANATAKAAQA